MEPCGGRERLEPGDDFRHHVGVVRPLQVGDAVSYCRNRDCRGSSHIFVLSLCHSLPPSLVPSLPHFLPLPRPPFPPLIPPSLVPSFTILVCMVLIIFGPPDVELMTQKRPKIEDYENLHSTILSKDMDTEQHTDSHHSPPPPTPRLLHLFFKK